MCFYICIDLYVYIRVYYNVLYILYMHKTDVYVYVFLFIYYIFVYSSGLCLGSV